MTSIILLRRATFIVHKVRIKITEITIIDIKS